jgi:hypothetical protein
MTTQIRSIGDLVAVRRAGANAAATAGSTGDNTEVVGVIIDRAALGFPQSCVFAVPFTTALGVGQTLSIAYLVQEGNAANLGDAETLQSAALAVVATGPEGGGTVTGTFEVNVPLAGAGRYVRFNYTPDLNRANTDTAALSAVAVFGGMDRLPQ